ncbi:MAG: hypothetical protein WDW38_004712 [Sanguina aurantia]
MRPAPPSALRPARAINAALEVFVQEMNASPEEYAGPAAGKATGRKKLGDFNKADASLDDTTRAPSDTEPLPEDAPDAVSTTQDVSLS